MQVKTKLSRISKNKELMQKLNEHNRQNRIAAMKDKYGKGLLVICDGQVLPELPEDLLTDDVLDHIYQILFYVLPSSSKGDFRNGIELPIGVTNYQIIAVRDDY